MALLLAGCGGGGSGAPAAENELETLEVGAGIGSEIQPDEDEKASVGAQFAGVLPGDFPRDLPVFTPSSLFERGDLEDGGRFVTLLTRSTAGEIEQQLSRDFKERGWRLLDDGGTSARAYRKGSRIVRIVYEESGPETLVRIEYTPLR